MQEVETSKSNEGESNWGKNWKKNLSDVSTWEKAKAQVERNPSLV